MNRTNRILHLACLTALALGQLACDDGGSSTPAATDAAAGTDATAGTDAAAGTDAETATDAAAGTDAETATDAVAATDAETATDAAAGTDAGTATDAAAGTDAETATDAAAGTDAETATDAAAGTDAGTATDAAAGTDAGTATDAAAGTDAEAATDTSTGTDATSGSDVDLSNVQSMCAYLKEDCAEVGGFCYDVTSSTCDYLAQKNLSHPACDTLGNKKSEAACVSHITDKSSPYYNMDECPLVNYWSNPSDYPIDCRCAGKFEDQCKRPYELEPKISFGTGPRMRDLASTVQAWNGLIDGNEFIVPVYWKTASKADQTMIFGIDLKTGNRRYISGTYTDPSEGYTTVGEGPAFITIRDMKKGADGKWYAIGSNSDIGAPRIFRIDPATGNRELLFDETTADTAKLCPNGSKLPGKKVIQMVAEAWTMDADGNHYFSYINMPGRGIVKFPADFSSCTYLTRVADTNQSVEDAYKQNVGTGYDEIQFQMRGLEVVGDKLYAISDTKLIEVSLVDGKRKLISNAKDIGGKGTGPINAEGLADRHQEWDPYRNIMWTHGISGASSAIAVDLATGDRFTWPCWHPGLGIQATCGNTGTALIPGYLSFGGMAIDPSPPHDLYFAHDLFSVVKYEVKTGNSYILSL